MQQYVMWGNQFQNQMWIKFNRDIGSMSARIVNTRERENLVYEYINSMGTILPAANYSFGKNMSGLYGDHEAFKKHFVRYWRNALNFSREESEKLKDIFDGELSSQESCERDRKSVV